LPWWSRLVRIVFVKRMGVRPEVAADHPSIHEVVREAFQDEVTAELVERIRRSANYIPSRSLVAEDGGAVVGHIMLSHLLLDDGPDAHRVVTLSPVSVQPTTRTRGSARPSSSAGSPGRTTSASR